jgi:hypothetical protein
MRQFLLSLLTLLILAPLYGEEHTCSNGTVNWNDAALHSRPSNPDFDHFQSFIVPQVSKGCVEVRDDVVMVILNFSHGVPDTFLVIPAAWVTKITRHEGNTEQKLAPPNLALSTAQPQTVAARKKHWWQ